MKLPAIDLPPGLRKIPGLSKFAKPKTGSTEGAAQAAGGSRPGAVASKATASSQEQQVIGRLDLTMKGFAVLAAALIILALYTIFAQNGLNKAIITAAPPTIDLAELAAAGSDGEADDAGRAAKAPKSAKAPAAARMKLPEGTDARLDFAFEQLADFENMRSEAVLRNSRATVAAVAPGSPAARAGFIPGDLILGVDGDQAGFVWDALRKLTAAGKSSVLIEVQRGPEVLRGELFAPEADLLTSSNSGLFFQIPEGYRFVGDNDRRDLRNAFTRSYLEGLAGDERLAYATSLAILGASMLKQGVGQTKLEPSHPNWLKTETILSDHHNKFNRVLAQHTAEIERMQAQLQAGFVKVGAYLLAALLAAAAAMATAVQHSRHLVDQSVAQVRAQFQALRAEVDQWMHTQRSAMELAAKAAKGPEAATQSSGRTPVAARREESEGLPSAFNAIAAPSSGPSLAKGNRPTVAPEGVPSNPQPAASVATLSLAELAARVALGSEGEEEKPRAASVLPEDMVGSPFPYGAVEKSGPGDSRVEGARASGPSSGGEGGSEDSDIGETDSDPLARAVLAADATTHEGMGESASIEVGEVADLAATQVSLANDSGSTEVDRAASASRTGDGASA